MDVRSDDTYWSLKNGTSRSFAQLGQDEVCDVVVLGGGITGALIADSLSRLGVETIVIDKHQIARGSTLASTALLQYEIDEPLYLLEQKIGREDAISAYRLCAQAINYIGDVCEGLPDDCDFHFRPSLYFSLQERDYAGLKKEYLARKEAGFAVQWLTKDEIKNRYGFDAYCAIRSEAGAELDPYRFTHTVLGSVQKRGGKIFESTTVTDIQTDVGIIVTTADGHTITAKKIIFAVGYEARDFLKEKTATLKSTFACVTKPVPEALWSERCLLWSTDVPYFYARTTNDNRILMGGEDIEYEDDELRDKFIPVKTKILHNTFNKLYPNIEIEIEHAWAGTFGETKDALPYIGESPEWKNAYFALGYGGNGAAFSVIAAQIVTDLYFGKENPYSHIFRFGR